MPSRTDCDIAIENSKIFLKVSDPDIKEGHVEMVQAKTAKGVISMPRGAQGAFAVVYKFFTKSNVPYALRCFLIPMPKDTEARYKEIGPYFQTHAPDITAKFAYHNPGISIKENEARKSFPIIMMEWVDGVTLLDKVNELCQKNEKTALGNLASQWLRVLRLMQDKQIAHGDLAAANVMVRPNGQLVLIDYDGVYIPAFKGLDPVVAGQADYQHPDLIDAKVKRKFGEHMDGFSGLVIYCALLALHIRTDLWQKYSNINDHGQLADNLLFFKKDFLDPMHSPLFRELEQLPNAQLKRAVQELKSLCQKAADQDPFPWHIVDPDFEKNEALAQLQKVIANDDDEQIVKAWVSIIDTFQPAQTHRQRVDLATQRLDALKDFRAALQRPGIQQIVDSYQSILDGRSMVTAGEREQLTRARNFIAASQDDDQLMQAYDAIQQSSYHQSLRLSPAEQQEVTRAQQIIGKLRQFKTALHSKDAQQIVTAYDSALDQNRSIASWERDVLKRATDYVTAYKGDSDRALAAAYDEIENFGFSPYFNFSAVEQARIIHAKQCQEALARLSVAFVQKNARQIVLAYDTVLDASKDLSQAERELVELSRPLVKAFNEEADESLALAFAAIEQSQHRKLLVFSPPEQQRIDLACQRSAALALLRPALASKKAQKIVDTYDLVLDDYKRLSDRERDVIQRARDFVRAYRLDDDQELAVACYEIENFYSQDFSFTQAEQQRISLAKRRTEVLARFQVALMQRSAQQIVNVYDPVLDGCKNVTPIERKQLQAARDFLKIYQSILEALKANNDKGDDAQLATLAKELEDLPSQYPELTPQQVQFVDVTPEQKTRLERAKHQITLKDAVQGRNFGLALRTAKILEDIYHLSLDEPGVRLAKMTYVLSVHPKNLEVVVQGNELVARWEWPADDLIQHAALAWRTDDWPGRLGGRQPGIALYHIPRSSYQAGNGFKFPVGQQTQVYIQVYSAIPDWSSISRQTHYYYSDGSDGKAPTAQKVISFSVKVL